MAKSSTTGGAGGAVSWMETEARRRLARAGTIRRKKAAFDSGAYGPAALARAAHLWSERQIAEEESVLVYVEVLLVGARAGASRAAQAVLLGMAQDEARHGEICRDVLSALAGGGPIPEGRRARPAPPPSERSAEETFLRQVIFGNCMTETINVARLVDLTERATDPFMHEALRQLFGDEVKHAGFGYQLLDEWRPWLSRHPDARRALDAFLPRAFFQLERDFGGVGANRDGYGPEDAALGSPDPATLGEVFFRTVEEAIVPGLEQLGFAARSGWSGRAPQPGSGAISDRAGRDGGGGDSTTAGGGTSASAARQSE
jgi:hypothetical protein